MTFRIYTPMPNFIEIHSVFSELKHTDRRTDTDVTSMLNNIITITYNFWDQEKNNKMQLQSHFFAILRAGPVAETSGLNFPRYTVTYLVAPDRINLAGALSSVALEFEREFCGRYRYSVSYFVKTRRKRSYWKFSFPGDYYLWAQSVLNLCQNRFLLWSCMFSVAARSCTINAIYNRSALFNGCFTGVAGSAYLW
jgi:hypothetical protein